MVNRFFTALNLGQYALKNEPFLVKSFNQETIHCPYERQYILRMPIKRPFDSIKLPFNLFWCRELIANAEGFQNYLNIIQPFCYLTIRYGLVESENDDMWHVDGFSTNITHLPEQNYIWTNVYPTEYIKQKFLFPSDFNPKVHNIHSYFQQNINKSTKIETFIPHSLYMIDPYIIHRRPIVPNGIIRTFVRISFTPIEIMDDNNTINPLIPIPKYNRDGIKDFRNKLIDYKK